VWQQCWFAHSLRKFAIHDWSIEQKWMTLLLPLLLLYDSKLALDISISIYFIWTKAQCELYPGLTVL